MGGGLGILKRSGSGADGINSGARGNSSGSVRRAFNFS
jgi:hypothetical protein